jgi:hypothetical protein
MTVAGCQADPAREASARVHAPWARKREEQRCSSKMSVTNPIPVATLRCARTIAVGYGGPDPVERHALLAL